jgi:hypothetical protein
MHALFLGKDIMGVVDGTIPKPTAANAQERDEWIKEDGHGIYYLSAAYDESILDLVYECTLSNAIWEKLKTIHDQRANDNIHDLQVKFYQCKFESSDIVASFISKVEVLKSQLTRLGDNSIKEANVVALVLGNLPNSFSHFHSVWDSTPTEDRTLNNILIRLVREELHMQEMQERE